MYVVNGVRYFVYFRTTDFATFNLSYAFFQFSNNTETIMFLKIWVLLVDVYHNSSLNGVKKRFFKKSKLRTLQYLTTIFCPLGMIWSQRRRIRSQKRECFNVIKSKWHFQDFTCLSSEFCDYWCIGFKSSKVISDSVQEPKFGNPEAERGSL